MSLHSERLASCSMPSVSVAIPAYNESDCIETVIRQFLDTRYPRLIEIVVADGGSTDGTQAIVAKIASESPAVKLISNPLKIQSAGLNQALDIGSGDVFLRVDAHSEYAADYIERCVEALLISQALNVGGAQRFAAKTAFQAGIAFAVKSPLGSGGAKYRDADYSGYAETVYLGCFWRKVLLELGGYRTDATANEDAELNLRLRNYALENSACSPFSNGMGQEIQPSNFSINSAIYISSTIRSWYYPRKSWRSLFLQYFRYGRGRFLTSIRHKNSLQIRGMLPFLSLAFLSLIVLLNLFLPNLNLPIADLILVGVMVPFLESLRIVATFHESLHTEIWREKYQKAPSLFTVWFYCGIALLTMPVAHAFGFAYQLFRNKILRISGW